MTIAIGDQIPSGILRSMSADGPVEHDIASMTSGKKVVIFGLPGAFTGTCTSAHLPSFMRTEAQFRDKGFDEIICVSVNDVFVMQAWAEATGADKTGLQLLADPDASFTKSLGMDFTAPPVGLIDRSKRYAMVVDDGKVTTLQVEDNPGECTISAGEGLLDAL